jgi:hypothetical protein
MHRRPPLRLLLGLFLTGLAACAVPPMDAVRDLAAIHTEDTWRPRTPADMTVPPAVYLGDATARRLGAGTYEVADHRTLELAIIDQLNAVDAADPAASFEVASWLLLALLRDDYGGARVQAAKVLSNLAGNWISDLGAQLDEEEPELSLTAGLAALQAAADGRQLNAAARALSRTAFPDAASALRTLTALGRLSDSRAFSVSDANEPLYSLGLKLVLIGLEEGARSEDAEVAEACRARYELLMAYARP